MARSEITHLCTAILINVLLLVVAWNTTLFFVFHFVYALLIFGNALLWIFSTSGKKAYMITTIGLTVLYIPFLVGVSATD